MGRPEIRRSPGACRIAARFFSEFEVIARECPKPRLSSIGPSWILHWSGRSLTVLWKPVNVFLRIVPIDKRSFCIGCMTYDGRPRHLGMASSSATLVMPASRVATGMRLPPQSYQGRGMPGIDRSRVASASDDGQAVTKCGVARSFSTGVRYAMVTGSTVGEPGCGSSRCLETTEVTVLRADGGPRCTRCDCVGGCLHCSVRSVRR
jgi:hypothetical protein